ncbi:protein kinase [Clostridium gasigenes]|uniref:protein kinase domain-containing protein n=1 Tax=Clostridium gasigenes TaxID=94869 RepID=UPI001625C4A7|nr:protein kinase [Clostridium gasigenes]MBB6625096.1 protein kinase [Clostridium gasigenes]
MKSLLRGFIKSNNKTIKLTLGEVSSLKYLGEGGNGLVYSGILNGQELALKFLVEDSNKKLVRFKAEYFNINLINRNESIVSYVDYDEVTISDKVFPIIIMKKYDGSLKDLKGCISIDESELLRFYKFLVNTLNSIHSQGIIHRDLKPENILINNNEYVLTDFGIASYNEELFSYKAETESNERSGNYNFSAPEQSIGGSSPSVCMDIYSLGQLCHWFVFNETHKGTSRKYFSSVLENTNRIQVLDSVINKCIANDPKDRYQSIEEIIEDFKLKFDKKKEADPFDEMYLLSDAIRSSEPEAYKRVKCIEDENVLKNLIKNIVSKDFIRNSLWFNLGFGACNITRLEYLEKNKILLNESELFIEKSWLYSSDDIYNDVIIFQAKTNDIEEYIIDGKKSFRVSIINDEHLVAPEVAESGYIKINNEVLKVSDLKCEYRDRYNTDRYFVIGTRWSCSLVRENDKYIQRFQGCEANEETIKELIINIRKNKHDYVDMCL